MCTLLFGLLKKMFEQQNEWNYECNCLQNYSPTTENSFEDLIVSEAKRAGAEEIRPGWGFELYSSLPNKIRL